MAGIVAISDPVVSFTAINSATQLPGASDGLVLSGGRNKGAALPLAGDATDDALLELVPAPGVKGKLSVTVTRGTSSIDNSSAVANLNVFLDAELTETFTNVTMDPDDQNYLPEVLRSSGLLRALDPWCGARHRASSHMVRPKTLTGGVSRCDDYQDALTGWNRMKVLTW